MAKARRKTEQPKGPIQRMLDTAANESASAPLVSPFAAQHGDYETNLRFVRNRGGTAIERWRRDGKLSDSQFAGILHCQNLWNKLGNQSIVADFDRIRHTGHGDGLAQHEALFELGRIAADFPPTYWDVFESVARHDLPAGVAGSRLSNVRRSAEIAARCIVAFVADIIVMKQRLSY